MELVVNGTRGWFNIAGFRFQPVEFAKIALILFLANTIAKQVSRIQSVRVFFMTALAMLFPFVLVLLQPDFGSGVILFAIWALMLFIAGANKKLFFAMAIVGILAGVVAWLFIFQPYQRDRIMTFLNPQLDPYGRGYHVRQALIAVGAGGIMGRGLGFGSQSQLKFIPASQTDFIFAVIAEELGFVGVVLVICLWALILYRLISAALRMNDDFGTIFLVGVSAVFFCHLAVNLGMNLGVVPVTGISLPLLSYGGSFLLTSLVLLGLAQSIIARNRSG